MFCRCRATVCSLRVSSVAISRFVRPRATSRSTSSCRAVRPCGDEEASGTSRPARSGAAPSSVNDRRAASSSSEAPSSSPSAPARTGDEDADPRGVVRGAELCPDRAGPAEVDQRGPRVAARELDGAPRLCDEGVEHLAPVPLHDRPELVARRTRLVHLAGVERDLDERGQQRRPSQRIRRLVERAAECLQRRVPTSLRDAEQGEARLRLPPEPARLAVRGLRLAQLAAEAVELAAPVGRLRRGAPVEAVREPRGGAARLRQRVVPRALELEDLRAMDETPARERDEVGLLAAPAREHPSTPARGAPRARPGTRG